MVSVGQKYYPPNVFAFLLEIPHMNSKLSRLERLASSPAIEGLAFGLFILNLYFILFAVTDFFSRAELDMYLYSGIIFGVTGMGLGLRAIIIERRTGDISVPIGILQKIDARVSFLFGTSESEINGQSKAKQAALSLCYLNKLIVQSRNESRIIGLFIIIFSLLNMIYAFSLHLILKDAAPFFIPVALMIWIIFIRTKIEIVRFRIENGFFGTNPAEARELIKFLISNSSNVNLNDGNGGIRQALLPPKKAVNGGTIERGELA